jgi:hypothetical protein
VFSLGVKPKESVRDYLDAEQLIEALEMPINSLANIGIGYSEIKNFVEQRYNPTLLLAG